MLHATRVCVISRLAPASWTTIAPIVRKLETSNGPFELLEEVDLMAELHKIRIYRQILLMHNEEEKRHEYQV